MDDRLAAIASTFASLIEDPDPDTQTLLDAMISIRDLSAAAGYTDLSDMAVVAVGCYLRGDQHQFARAIALMNRELGQLTGNFADNDRNG